MYVIEKTLATMGTFSVLLLIVEHYILPVSPNATDDNVFISMLDLAIPFTLSYLLIFVRLFHFQGLRGTDYCVLKSISSSNVSATGSRSLPGSATASFTPTVDSFTP